MAKPAVSIADSLDLR